MIIYKLLLRFLQNNLYIVNASKSQIWKTLNITGSPLNEFVASIVSRVSSIETELLNKLAAIYKLGFHPSTTNADNGVGDTLENLLGIKRNSNRSPDYKGIELKATRLSNKNNMQLNRSNLFSKIPNWDLSTLKSGSEILNKYGYCDSPGEFELAKPCQVQKQFAYNFSPIDWDDYLLHFGKELLSRFFTFPVFF